MNLHKLLLKNNNCYKAGVKMTPKGLMLHSTGAKNKTLKRYVGPDDGLLGHNSNGNHWNTAKPEGISACVHGFIGELADGTVATYQTLPWERGDCYRGWHAGKAAGNDGYIGVEICEDGLADPVYFGKAYQETVELNAYLCIMHGLNPLTDIICHSEGYKKGIATNHGDVMHWFPKHGKNMDTFRADVKAAMGSTGTANAGGVTASVVPSAPAGTSTASKGTVLYFQQWLNKTYGFNIKEDNKPGSETKKAAVKALQTELNKLGAGLVVDGRFGPLTRAALARHNIHKGQKGSLACIVQGLCICHGCSVGASGIDGSFGADTDKGVRKFQGVKGIKADGIVGSGTFGKFVA